MILLPILLLVVGSVLAGTNKAGPNHGTPKVVTECGTFLTEPGNYKLVKDLLDCPVAGVEIQGSDNADGIAVWWGEGDNGSSGNLIRGNLVTDNQNMGIAFLGFYWQDPGTGQEWYYAMPRGNTIRSNIVEQQLWMMITMIER